MSMAAAASHSDRSAIHEDMIPRVPHYIDAGVTKRCRPRTGSRSRTASTASQPENFRAVRAEMRPATPDNGVDKVRQVAMIADLLGSEWKHATVIGVTPKGFALGSLFSSSEKLPWSMRGVGT